MIVSDFGSLRVERNGGRVSDRTLPRHFRQCITRLTDADLVYEATIGPTQREASCLNLADSFAGIDDILARLTSGLPRGWCSTPRHPAWRASGSLCKPLSAEVFRTERSTSLTACLRGLSRDGPFTRWPCAAPEEVEARFSSPLLSAGPLATLGLT